LGVETNCSYKKLREAQEPFKRGYLDQGEKCFVEANIDDQANVCREIGSLLSLD
jgi:hypothetical protein